MKINISNVASKVNSAVGVAAGIAIGLAVTLTATVHIKHCIKDLLPAKKRNVEIHVYECHDDEEQPEASEAKPEEHKEPYSGDEVPTAETETVETDSVKYFTRPVKK